MLNLKKYKCDSSVNTLMTKKSIFQFNQNNFSSVRNESLRFKHVFLNTCTDKIKIYHV